MTRPGPMRALALVLALSCAVQGAEATAAPTTVRPPPPGLPAPQGLAAPATRLVAGVRLGQSVDTVVRAAAGAGAEARHLSGDTPGALAAGLMERPDLLALLHQRGVQPPGLVAAEHPEVVVAELAGARAAYWFVQDRLWAMALALPQRAVAPRPDPFDPDRMRPLWDALAAACPGMPVAARDRRGNPRAWAGACAGGTGRMEVDARDRDAAVRVVLWTP